MKSPANRHAPSEEAAARLEVDTAETSVSGTFPPRWPQPALILGLPCASLLVLLSCYLFWPEGGRKKPAGLFEGEIQGVVPGEFEQQDMILLAWPRQAGPPYEQDIIDQSREENRLFCDIVRAVRGHIDIAVLIENPKSRERIDRLLREAAIPADALQFVEVPFRTMWIRDYGPLALKTTHGRCTWIDADYFKGDLVTSDYFGDRLPSILGAQFEVPTVRVPLAIQHGNLLSNGRGLCITTDRILSDNALRGFDREDVSQILKRFYGAREVVFLEPLQGEVTGHADMFATVPAPDTVVVGQYPVSLDPVNAAILDRNAERLAAVGPPCGPLNVVRMPMPPPLRAPAGPVLRPTYTNVVYANGVLLVPTCPGLDPAGEAYALALYGQLLPDWKIVPIDARPLVAMFGSLHCATMNVASVNDS